MKGCWYSDGLRFECQNCGYCCGHEPGYVFLGKEDIRKLAASFNMSENQFIEKFCRPVDTGISTMVSLAEKENYDCIFLTENGCSVYESRPLQCRTYPFWEHITETEDSWKEEAEYCPGINRGTLKTKEEINALLEARRLNMLF